MTEGNRIFNVAGNYIENQTINVNEGGTLNFGVPAECKEADRGEKETLTEASLKEKVELVREQIKTNRLWFPVCKYMMWEGLVADGDFKAAVGMLKRLFPLQKFDADDLAKLNVQSWRKPLAEWKEEDSPVQGVTFSKYKNIAVALYNS